MLMCSRFGFRFKMTTINRYVICPFSLILTTSLHRKWRNASMVGFPLKQTPRIDELFESKAHWRYVQRPILLAFCIRTTG